MWSGQATWMVSLQGKKIRQKVTSLPLSFIASTPSKWTEWLALVLEQKTRSACARMQATHSGAPPDEIQDPKSPFYRRRSANCLFLCHPLWKHNQHPADGVSRAIENQVQPTTDVIPPPHHRDWASRAETCTSKKPHVCFISRETFVLGAAI